MPKLTSVGYCAQYSPYTFDSLLLIIDHFYTLFSRSVRGRPNARKFVQRGLRQAIKELADCIEFFDETASINQLV